MPGSSLPRLPALLACSLALSTVAQAQDPRQERRDERALEGPTCTQLQYTDEAPALGVRDDAHVTLDADHVLLEDNGFSDLMGKVVVRQGDKVFSADQMTYDDINRIVTVHTESFFRNEELIVKSKEASFDLDDEHGTFKGAKFTLPSRAARGTAERIDIDSNGVATLDNASYTTCAPGSAAWSLEANHIKLDQNEGLGTASGAKLHFFDVPIVYIPWFQFPTDDRRRTGLLYPTVGQLSGSGLDMRWPVYLNLAPNYDATLTPRYLSNRGLQPQVDFRYLLDRGKGDVHAEYLDDSKFGDDRSMVRFNHVGLFNDRLGLEATYSEASDRRYFEDMGGALQSSSVTHLEQSARLTYQSPGAYTIQALVQNFQPIASNLDSIDDPYKRLPDVRFDALTRHAFLDTRAGVSSEFVNFARDDSVEGGRFDVSPFLRFEKDAAAWYFSSQADLHYTTYELADTSAGQNDSPSRTLPVVSAETGLRFERLTDNGRLQLLEPKGFALYVPYKNQDNLPVFDTGEPDFDFVQLFARNRFSGDDRLADARHVAGAATLRQIDPETGISDWAVSIGQLYRFRAPRVTLPDAPPPDKGATEFIGQVEYRISQWWTTVAGVQWSPENDEFDRASLGMRYRDDRQRQFDVAYRYRRGLLEQTDVGFLLPVIGPFRFAAQSRYSMRDDKPRETYVGLEYGSCCWAIRTSWRRYIKNAQGDFGTGLYVMLELKGLSRLGAGYDTLLPRSEEESDQLY